VKKIHPQSTAQERRLVQSIDKAIFGERWQTVRDAVTGLPDPREGVSSKFSNHEFRGGARPYVGHSGNIRDESPKAIKAGTHGVSGGETMIVIDDVSLRFMCLYFIALWVIRRLNFRVIACSPPVAYRNSEQLPILSTIPSYLSPCILLQEFVFSVLHHIFHQKNLLYFCYNTLE
jgi:hypothetical protein